LAFADGQGFAFEVSEENGNNEYALLGAWFRMMRAAVAHAIKATAGVAVVRFGRLKESSS